MIACCGTHFRLGRQPEEAVEVTDCKHASILSASPYVMMQAGSPIRLATSDPRRIAPGI